MALPKGFEIKSTSGPTRYCMSQLKSDNQEEEIKLRFVSDFITGLSVWGPKEDNPDERTQYFYKEDEPVQTQHIGINKFTGGPENIRQFLAAVCYNYNTERLEVFSTDKAQVIQGLVELEADEEDFGDVKNYDVKIKRSGFKKDTTYTVKGLATKPAPKEVLDAIEAELDDINLEVLYHSVPGKDPFKLDSEEAGKLAKDIEDVLG